jgi:hypothetical protein
MRGGLLALAIFALATFANPALLNAAMFAATADWETAEPLDQENLAHDKLTALVDSRKQRLSYPYWAEAKSRNYQAQLGDDGTYKKSGEFIAAMFGMTIDYNYKNIYLHCDGTNLSEENTFAAYCSSALSKIYVNTNIEGFDWISKSAYYPAAIRHEMAHLLIGKICAGSGNTTPEIAGDKSEAATSSFAVLFLGADRTQLNNVDEAEYWMTATTDDIATEIHDDFKCE